jgi:pimeloyl-ACP methyl ester carboxylesterase
MGAIVSWEYVDQFGTDGIRALVDVDMEPSPLEREGYDHGSYTVDDLREALVEIQTDPVGRAERGVDALLKEPPSRELRTTMVDEETRTPPSIQGAMLLELLRDYRDVLPRVDVPALVCAGADETWRTVASVEYAADLLPDAEFELFEDSGHCITVEEPERFNRVLRDFVEAL